MTALNYIQDDIFRTASQFGIQCLPMPISTPMDMYADAQTQSANSPAIALDNNFRRCADDSQPWLWIALIVGTCAAVHPAPISGPTSGPIFAAGQTGVNPALVSQPVRRLAPAAASVSECLAVIRTAFSLQISQIAEILQVSRPTIYAWISDERQPHQPNRDRLNDIYALAKFWNTISALPLGAAALLAPDAAGATLFDRLKESEVDLNSAKERLQAMSRQADMQVAPLRVADLARKYGIALDLNRLNSSEFDLMTRPPMDET